MSSITIVVDKNNRLTRIIVSKDGPVAHLVRELAEDEQDEAILRYDSDRDSPVPGYGRSGHTSYGPEFAFTTGISFALGTVPKQP